ncbi:MAG: hypothetical protein OEV91_01375 [Desulfobulbaceae bacterium]|nr:hypothetical protein [Desulfobulbaceae bacterium]
MKVHVYKFSHTQNCTPLEELLNQILVSDLNDRIREIGHQKVRVEQIVHDGGFWYLDFIKFRDGCGPGKLHPEREIEGFNFENEECFGEETAMLFNPANNYILFQYNQHGVRHKTAQNYLNFFNHQSHNKYEFLPKFDEETERKFHDKSIFRRIDFNVASRYMSESDRKNGMSVYRAIGMGSEHGADRIFVSIRAGKGNKDGLSAQRVRETVSALKKILSIDDKAVSCLEVVGKDASDKGADILDFLGKRLALEYDIVPGPDKRLPLPDRWASLRSAHAAWQQILV